MSDLRGGEPAALQDSRFQRLQLVLFSAGAVLMPLGIVAIYLGWYGAAHARYSYDQFPYLLSGGLLGLGLTFIGGFLYFGACVAKVGSDQKEASRQVAEALLHLECMVVSQQTASGLAPTRLRVEGAASVLAGSGATVHQHDCALIAQRDDLQPLSGDEVGLTTCRVCRPSWDVSARPRRAASKAGTAS